MNSTDVKKGDLSRLSAVTVDPLRKLLLQRTRWNSCDLQANYLDFEFLAPWT